jgi:phage terminase large subunit-like protein
VLLHDELRAACIVIEDNQGGDMAEHVLVTSAEKLHREGKRKTAHLAIRRVHASVGKRARAEPIAALYEQHRVRHLGVLAKLEDQLTTWDATTGKASPDRLDALVWALWWLCLEHAPIKPKTARSLAQRAKGLLQPRS